MPARASSSPRCLPAPALAVGLVLVGVAARAGEPEIAFYASARLQIESVRPDDRAVLGSYTDLRDAYSRIGFNAGYALSDRTELFGQLELPLDLANGAVQDPWDQDEDIRIARTGVRGEFGSFTLGQMWMPYYNAIACAVDRFSSYYSGFATYTSFRLSDTLAFESPVFGGLSFAAAWSRRNGAPKPGGTPDDRLQIAASYRLAGDTVISLAVDDLGGEADWRIYGVSLIGAVGNLHIGAKAEMHSSHIRNAYGADGDRAINLYAGYTVGRNTFKIMVANVDRYGEGIVHLGVDHRLSDRRLLFAEYYYEQETAAITEKRGGLNETAWEAGGGQVLLGGMRFDF
jgi:predicted porin